MYFHSPTRADRNSLQPKCSRGYQLSANDTGTSFLDPPSIKATRLSPSYSASLRMPAIAAIVGTISMLRTCSRTTRGVSIFAPDGPDPPAGPATMSGT